MRPWIESNSIKRKEDVAMLCSRSISWNSFLIVVDLLDSSKKRSWIFKGMSCLSRLCFPESSWATWSPWIRLNDRDFRFRRCLGNNGHLTVEKSCIGASFEERQCTHSEEKLCRLRNNTVTEEVTLNCRGIELDDLERTGKCFWRRKIDP